jgi:hypothetical protein
LVATAVVDIAEAQLPPALSRLSIAHLPVAKDSQSNKSMS